MFIPPPAVEPYKKEVCTAGAVTNFIVPSNPYVHLKSPRGWRGQILMGVTVRDAGLAFGRVSSVVWSLAFGNTCLPGAGHHARLRSIVNFTAGIWIFSLSRVSLACPAFPCFSALQTWERTCHSRLSSQPLEKAVLRAHVDGACWSPGSLRCLRFHRLKSSRELTKQIQTFLQYFMIQLFC